MPIKTQQMSPLADVTFRENLGKLLSRISFVFNPNSEVIKLSRDLKNAIEQFDAVVPEAENPLVEVERLKRQVAGLTTEIDWLVSSGFCEPVARTVEARHAAKVADLETELASVREINDGLVALWHKENPEATNYAD